MTYEQQLLQEATDEAGRLLIACQEFIRLPKNKQLPLESSELQKMRDRMRNLTTQINAIVKKARRKEVFIG